VTTYVIDGVSALPVPAFSSIEGTHQVVSEGTKLCLNISTASPSPGDGKNPGGPGNLIQWNCSDGTLRDNELFGIVSLGGGRVQIRVKSSGVCLEDPGRGGTVRQNRCNQSIPNQVFVLT
jgi:hypothetical protein